MEEPNKEKKTSKIHENKPSKLEDQHIIDLYERNNPWGMNVSIDLYECEPKLIKDKKYVKKFILELVDFINMKAYGEPIVVDFGDKPRVAGISAVQLIETSSITAHFANFSSSAYIDVFSCKSFRPHVVSLFCKKYFNADEVVVSDVVFRY